jgi:hypothetical protein
MLLLPLGAHQRQPLVAARQAQAMTTTWRSWLTTQS